MALSFSNDQIKTISKDILELPKIIDFPLNTETGEGGTGLVQQQENVVLSKDAIYVTDQQNKIFTDHWISVADSYHLELETLSLVKRSNYLDSYIEEGGKSLPPHYTPTHPKLIPIVIPSNNGLPTSASTIEEDITPKIARLNEAVNTYINGKTGSKSDDLQGTWIEGQAVETLNGTLFTVGENVFLIQGANIMLAQVASVGGSCTGETPPLSGTNETLCNTNGGTWNTSITLTALSEPKVFTSGAKIQNYSPAFTNAQRGRQASVPANDVALMLFLEENIDKAFLDIIAYEQSVHDITIANGDTNGSRKTNNSNFVTSILGKIDEHATWLASPLIDVEGKYTNSKLPQIKSSIEELSVLNSDRISQITTMLGNVTDGSSVTGDGVYFDLWKFIVIRIAKSGGTLYGWYGMDLAVAHFDTKIANATSQLNEYQTIFNVKKLTSDVTLGENEVTVDNTDNLVENDSIKIFDNETPVFDLTITEINGNILTLNQGLLSDLLAGNIARIVKEN